MSARHRSRAKATSGKRASAMTAMLAASLVAQVGQAARVTTSRPTLIAQNSQEEQRRKLLEEIGLREKRRAPAPPVPPAGSPSASPSDTPGAPDSSAGSVAPSPTAPSGAPSPARPEARPARERAAPAPTEIPERRTPQTAPPGDQRPEATGPAQPAAPAARPAATVRPAGPSFRAAIHPMLLQNCRACHGTGGPAATTRLVLSGEVAADHAAVMRTVDTRNPRASALLTKGSGQMHGGGAVWPAGGTAQARALAWIEGGARMDSAAAPVRVAPEIPAVAGAAPRTTAMRRVPKTATVGTGRAGTPAGSAEQAAAADQPESGDAANAQVLKDPDATEPLPEPPDPDATEAPAPEGQPAPVAQDTSPAPPAATSQHHSYVAGARLPMGLSLNGRFDVTYERGTFTGSPFASGATNGLRSYHHFLFLSRDSTDDPLGLSVELLSLQFWEARYRHRSRVGPWQAVVAGGKILVPFGAEPLYHQSYGGLAGFDQRLLPPIWAQEGVRAQVVFHQRELAITDDLYVVRGYALRQGDSVLNLQNDFSSADDARVGVGNRVGVSWGPVSGWYSTYFNPLGFGRRLFMQSADVMLWRMRGVPVLEYMSASAGLMRADVSGGAGPGVGGPGNDYYHFGSYLQLRAHPTDWLYVQYRQGLRTFNNRRGLWIDDTRLTSDDGSTHNFAIVARQHGLSVGLYYFINLEKGTEVPNDLFRVSVVYEF